jgi:hypothetical protein
MVFVEGDDYRALRRPGDDPAQFRSPVRFGAVPSSAVVDGLVAWYRFEDPSNTAIDATNELGVGSDTTAFDGTVNGASYVENGGVTDILTGTNSGAYDFDGVDDSISDVKAAPQPPVTILASVDMPTPNDFSRVYSSTDTNIRNGYAISLRAIDDTYLSRVAGPNSETTIKTSVNFSSISQLGLTYDGSEMRQFIDGNIVATNPTSLTPSLNPAKIGAPVNATQEEHSNGIIDDVRIYNRVLSGTEINQIYNNTKP